MDGQDENKGVFALNNVPVMDSGTVVVTGVGRSGTTMAARLVAFLGIHSGDRLTPSSFEDKQIQEIITKKDLDSFAAVCRRRDGEHKFWTFKSPAIIHQLEEALPLIRNPRLIVTFRDPLAVSLRNNREVDTDVLRGIARVSKSYANFASFCSSLPAPMLLISYEKALQYPRNTAIEIARFCGVDASNEIIDGAVNEIRNGDPRYISGTRRSA